MKAGRSVLTLSRWAGIALALVMPASGCCGTKTYPEAACATSAANVSVSAPAALDLAPTLLLISVASCLDSAGQCSGRPSFSLDTIGNQPGPNGEAPRPGTRKVLRLRVAFPETAAGTTLTLPSPDIIAMSILDTYPPLAVSGTISVESASPSGFQLSLQLELQTDDGQTITVSGPVSASNCAVRQVPLGCGGGFFS